METAVTMGSITNRTVIMTTTTNTLFMTIRNGRREPCNMEPVFIDMAAITS